MDEADFSGYRQVTLFPCAAEPLKKMVSDMRIDRGSSSPWGQVQHSDKVSEHVYIVSTAGHGGAKLYREANNKIPAQLRRKGGWYEEDCEISIPIYYGLIPGSKEHARRDLEHYYSEALLEVTSKS